MIKILGLTTCYNRAEKTSNAIEKLIKYNPQIDFHFIVADDNSTDGTRQLLQQFPRVEVLCGNGSMYYSGGMRLAIATAKGKAEEYDYCLLFNDDVDFLEKSIEYLTSLEENTIWVGPTCGTDGELSYGGVVKCSGWRPKYEIIKSETEEGRNCDTFNANCVLLPWDIFLSLDNIDSVYVHSFGDYDYGFEAMRAGYTIKVAQRYVGICDDNEATGSWRDRRLSRKKRLSLKESPKGLPRDVYFHFLKKNHGLFTAVVYSVIPYIRIILGL